jgi:hypothetical protein
LDGTVADVFWNDGEEFGNVSSVCEEDENTGFGDGHFNEQ